MPTKVSAPDSDSASPVHTHNWLRDLIQLMHQVMLSLATRLLHARTRLKVMTQAKDKNDLWGRLETHITEMPVETRSQGAPRAAKTDTKQGNAAQLRTHSTNRERGELGKHYMQRAAGAHRPHIDETLKAKTLEHINIALSIARQGNKKGAKLHIHLAEDAMHLASRFMSYEDHEKFRKVVEQRLASVVSNVGSQRKITSL